MLNFSLLPFHLETSKSIFVMLVCFTLTGFGRHKRGIQVTTRRDSSFDAGAKHVVSLFNQFKLRLD